MLFSKQQLAMSSEFTEADRAKVLSVLTKITEEDKDEYHVYHDIYHVLKDSCNCRIPENKILPEREDLLRFLQRKMLDHEVHGRVHERLIQLVENLPAADTFLAESGLFCVFNDPKEYEEVFVVIIISLEEICLKVFKVAVKNVLA